MALPYTVNGLISTAGAIDHATYNDLQLGMVAGAFGTQEIIVQGAAFQQTTPNSNYANPAVPIPEFDGDSWNFAAGISVGIRAPLVLAVGIKIESIIWRFNKNSNAAALSMALKKKALGAVAINVPGSLLADVSSGAASIEVTSVVNYVAEAGFALSLGVNAGNVAHAFECCRILISKPF